MLGAMKIEVRQINPKCGEIWMCNLTEKEGSIQAGYRPVFVLSNDKNNTFSPTLNVIPITSKMSKKYLPIHVSLWDYQLYGLRKPSTMLVEQITTVSVDKLETRVGVIKDMDTLTKIHKAMEIQFPILTLFSS